MLCESIAKEIPETEFPCDFSQDYLPTESGFNACIMSRKQWEDEGFPELSETSHVCFNDGSRIHSSTGAAYIEGNNSTGVIPLGTHASVFQAEVMAILKPADFLISICDREIHVFVDSLSVLHSLTTGWKTSSLVQECFQALQDIVSKNSLTLHWIPVIGVIGVSCDSIRSTIKNWARLQLVRAWQSTRSCKQAKQFLSTLQAATRRYLLSFSLRSSVQILTGHTVLNKHLHTIGAKDSSYCTLCTNGVESTAHFVGKCEPLTSTRHLCLGTPILEI
jgi:hypothetical protein